MNGIFDSKVPKIPAVSATGFNGAGGIQAASDNGGIGVQGTSTGAAGEQNATGGVGVSGSAEAGGLGVSGRCYGVNEDHNPGTGVSGVADSGGTGVRGEAWGIREDDGSPARGVVGYSPEGVGVYGMADSSHGVGVAGYSLEGGIGVYGESRGGFAMSAQGPTTQSRESGGWVKAMVHVVAPKQGLPTIDRFFNSQPTKIQVHHLTIGVLVIDFGFIVQDRFVAATPELRSAFYVPEDPDDLSRGWSIQPYDEDGNDTAHVTLSLAPPLAVAMVSFPREHLVQVESFRFKTDPLIGTVSYQRANTNVFVTVF